MFTLAIKNKLLKTTLVYAVFSILLIGINWVYGLFGHGVHSAYMTYMFLYPLLGGTLFYFSLYKSIPRISKSKAYRFFYNLYNSGIATLALGSFLYGILEIAGTNSDYLKYFFISGFGFVGLSILTLVVAIILQRSAKNQEQF